MIQFSERGVIGSQCPNIFCRFLLFVGIEKNALIWYKVYVLRTSYVGNFRSDS